MEILNLVRELAPATLIVAFAALPWIAAASMQVLSAALKPRLDDDWKMRTIAGVRWSGAIDESASGTRNAVLPFAVRRAARTIAADSVDEFFPHAA